MTVAPPPTAVTLWAMAGAAPTSAARRAILSELARYPVTDVYHLLMCQPDLGPAVESLTTEDLLITDDASSLCLAGALLADPRALHHVNWRLTRGMTTTGSGPGMSPAQQMQRAYVGLALNPATPHSVSRAAFDAIPGRGLVLELAAARCRNHAASGRPPMTGSALSTVFGGDRNVMVTALAHQGFTLEVIMAALSRFDPTDRDRARTDTATRLGGLVQDGCPPALVRWALSGPERVARTGLVSLSATDWSVLADRTVRRIVVDHATSTAESRPLAVDIVSKGRRHLTAANLRRLEDTYPGISAVGEPDGPAGVSPHRVLLAELAGASSDTWVQAARMLTHLVPGEVTSVRDLVAAAGTAAARPT